MDKKTNQLNKLRKNVQQLPLDEAINKLEAQRVEYSKPSRSKILARKIIEVPNAFQPRQDQHDSQHIKTLAKAAKDKGALDRVEVLPITYGYVVVDGAHRLQAMLQAGIEQIPCRILAMSAEQAVLHSGYANARPQLQMTPKSRYEYAWKLLLSGRYSKRKVADAASVSTGLVGRMRALLNNASEMQLRAMREMTWGQAQMLEHQGEPLGMTEEQIEEEVDRLCRKLYKHAGSYLSKPEVLGRAFAAFAPEKAKEAFRDAEDDLADEDDGDLVSDDDAQAA